MSCSLRHRNKAHLIASFFSGLECNLANSAYNACYCERGAAAYALKALAGIPYEQFKGTCLHDVFVTVHEHSTMTDRLQYGSAVLSITTIRSKRE